MYACLAAERRQATRCRRNPAVYLDGSLAVGREPFGQPSGYFLQGALAPVRKGINPFTRQPIEIVGEGPPLGRLILAWPERL